MAYGQPSGTVVWEPFASDVVLDALERVDIFAPEAKHMFSARRSANLLLSSRWSARGGINLWKMDSTPTVVPLIQGVDAYLLTPDVVAVYDTYRRQYNMGAPANVTSAFTTTLNSTTVTVSGVSAAVGNYISIPVPVAIGGIVLSGFYQVQSTPTATSVTITAASAATSGAGPDGSVPAFTTTNGSTSVNVLLANHGYVAGGAFNVAVSTAVGGIAIFGSYTIAAIVDANNFTITASSAANAGATVSENGGLAQVGVQIQGQSAFTDILMSPLSRNDYAAQANKTASGPPTTYWVERLNTARIVTWPVADQNGPYEMRMYTMRQIQDFNPSGGQTLDLPQKMLYCFTCDLAEDLSIKFAPKKYEMLAAVAARAWGEASAEDVEHTSTSIMPNFPSGL